MKKLIKSLAALLLAGLVLGFAGCKTESSDDSTDSTPPAKVTVAENAVTAANSKALITWTNPADSDFYATRVTVSPALESGNSSLVIEGKAGEKSTVTFEGLTNGTKYTFTLYAMDKSLNVSDGVTVTATPEDTSDKTAPADVTGLTVVGKDKSVLLTWTDAADEDIYGYEVSWAAADSSASSRAAVEALKENSMIVAKGVGGAIVRNLTNGTEYTFTVKSVDTSLNKSSGVPAKATPKEVSSADTLKIALSVPEAKSNTSITVYVNITTAGTVKKVVYKKNGSINPAKLLADTGAKEATVDEDDNAKWTFKITATDETANGTYTVAAIDSDGREEIWQIEISNFDFTAPAKLTGISGTYSESDSKITISWTNPTDEDFDHVEICYTTNDGDADSGNSASEKVTGNEKTYSKIDSSKAYYTFYFVSVDKLGNTSKEITCKVRVKATGSSIPDDFVEVKGGTITGASNTNNYKGVFIEGRTVTLSDFYMGKYEVTQAEYKEMMQNQKVTVDGKEYTLNAEPSYCTKANSTEYALDIESLGEVQEKRPVEGVTWYDAVYYCNARSEKESLTPAYNIEITTVNSSNHITAATVTLVENADGYRLPTEAEWEYAARGGDPTKEDWNYVFSGADSASGTTYSSSSNSGLDSVGWYCYNNKDGTTGTSGVTSSADGKGTHGVGKKDANRLGIYDMSGNVWEWCYDWYGSISTGEKTDPVGHASGASRVSRGGGWYYNASFASVSYRNYGSPGGRGDILGFRVVRSSSK